MNFLNLLKEVKFRTGHFASIANTNFLKGNLLKKFLLNTIVNTGKIKIRSDKKNLDFWTGKYLDKLWMVEWKNIVGHRQMKFWLKGPDPTLSKLLRNMNRKQLGGILQFLTGHGWWKAHLALAKLDENSECRLCLDGDETPMHLYNDCDAMKWARVQFLGCFYDPPIPIPHSSIMKVRCNADISNPHNLITNVRCTISNVEWQQVLDFIQSDDICFLHSFVKRNSTLVEVLNDVSSSSR